MAIQFDANGYPIWKRGFSTEERRQYRRCKHRAHAARSRRLRGKEAVYRGKRGDRTDWDSNGMPDQSTASNRVFPKPGDYNGDGVAE